MDKNILRWISILPLAAFLMRYGYHATFNTHKLLQYYEDRSNIKPGSLLYRMRLAKPKQIFWMKLMGPVMILLGLTLIVLQVWASIYDR